MVRGRDADRTSIMSHMGAEFPEPARVERMGTWQMGQQGDGHGRRPDMARARAGILDPGPGPRSAVRLSAVPCGCPQAVVQAPPLRVKPVGLGLVLPWLARKPTVTEPPAGMELV